MWTELNNRIVHILNHAPLLALFVVFWVGALASLGSCTIIRLPIVLGYVLGAGDSKKRAVTLTLLFVLGLVVCYTIFGVLIGLVGDFVHGFTRFNRYIFCILGILLVVFGIHISGLISFGKKEHQHGHLTNLSKNVSLLGALVFGLAFALLELPTCPCCGAVLLAISSVVLAKNLSWYAIIVFISFALGQSFPIFAIGLTTSLIKADLVGTVSHRIHRFEQKLKFMAGNILILIGASFLIIA